ncbi:hypothetical protein D1953_05345 [Peribacillus asahii]|uniref:Uncharacterized protein n=1 Tax=Peribacillus asahii TaxID=228899 RepID=A0A398BIN9_9BACI|nr:hypothetical protein [Peribacillus asahii]RID87610.1 hypothetical protein D1953_05345 [Peribacillus asahii]
MQTYPYDYPAYSYLPYPYSTYSSYPIDRYAPEHHQYDDERFFPLGLGLAIPAAFIAGLAVPLLWNRPFYPPYPSYPGYYGGLGAPGFPGYYGGFGPQGVPAYPPQMTAQAATSDTINIYNRTPNL